MLGIIITSFSWLFLLPVDVGVICISCLIQPFVLGEVTVSTHGLLGDDLLLLSHSFFLACVVNLPLASAFQYCIPAAFHPSMTVHEAANYHHMNLAACTCTMTWLSTCCSFRTLHVT